MKLHESWMKLHENLMKHHEGRKECPYQGFPPQEKFNLIGFCKFNDLFQKNKHFWGNKHFFGNSYFM